jgi:hypothetical protein
LEPLAAELEGAVEHDDRDAEPHDRREAVLAERLELDDGWDRANAAEHHADADQKQYTRYL